MITSKLILFTISMIIAIAIVDAPKMGPMTEAQENHKNTAYQLTSVGFKLGDNMGVENYLYAFIVVKSALVELNCEGREFQMYLLSEGENCPIIGSRRWCNHRYKDKLNTCYEDLSKNNLGHNNGWENYYALQNPNNIVDDINSGDLSIYGKLITRKAKLCKFYSLDEWIKNGKPITAILNHPQSYKLSC